MRISTVRMAAAAAAILTANVIGVSAQSAELRIGTASPGGTLSPV